MFETKKQPVYAKVWKLFLNVVTHNFVTDWYLAAYFTSVMAEILTKKILGKNVMFLKSDCL